MKKVALVLSLILAIGWISDTGRLTLKIGDNQIVGVQTEEGYAYTIKWDGWETSFIPMAPKLQWKLFGLAAVGVIVNSEYSKCTRLGNGWLFSFNEKEAK